MAGFTLPITLPLSWQSAHSAQFWAGQDRRIYARFYVSRPDGVTWEDLTSYLVSARISLGNVADVGTGNSGVDTGVRQATFELINDRPTVDSLHPRDRLSSWNQWGGVYAPLLWPTREVILDVAAVPVGVTPGPADWVRMFHGFMGDSISASSDNGRIVIECRDLMKRLQDAYIETVREYGSEAGTPAEEVMQQIINDNVANPPTLYVPVSPGFMVRPYKCEYSSVADALWQIANQFGGWIGYRWIPDYNDFRLTLLIPPRSKDAACADWAFDGRQIIVQHLDISDRDVRNALVVTYRDSATGTRQSVTLEDAASIAEFGRRAMQIEEADTSLIDTAAEATALAQVVVHDLKDLTAATRINMPLLPTMDVFDGILVTNPRLSSTQDFYAVESVEHVLDFDRGQFRTEVIASGRVVGGHAKWLLMQTRPGSPAHWQTNIVEKYTWQDHFIKCPYEPSLWTSSLTGTAFIGESASDYHAITLTATAAGDEARLTGVIAASRDMGVSTHRLTVRAYVPGRVDAGAGFGIMLVERSLARSAYAAYVGADNSNASAVMCSTTFGASNQRTRDIALSWDAWHVFRIVVTASDVRFYIDDLLVATHTLYVPADSSRLAVDILSATSSSSAGYTLRVDYVIYEVA